MTHAYNELYLNDAKKSFSQFLDYLINDCKLESDWVATLFANSDFSKGFEGGNPFIVSGRSGVELARDLIRKVYKDFDLPEATYSNGFTPEYWAGWVLAEYQWYSGRAFKDIFNSIKLSEIIMMYPLYHEMDITRFIEAINDRFAKIKIDLLLGEFMVLVANNEIDIYNEISLQHELGIFLRKRIIGYKVQFERNVNFFDISDTVKHEIDIVIYNENEKYAIELKFPTNGQYPEQMFSFVKDIKFMEVLKEKGFNNTYCLTLVQDKNFYSGKRQSGIYAYFRGEEPIQGEISKPTGKKEQKLNIEKNYIINWRDCGKYKYYLITF